MSTIVIIDLEMTGLDPSEERIMQMSYAIIDNPLFAALNYNFFNSLDHFAFKQFTYFVDYSEKPVNPVSRPFISQSVYPQKDDIVLSQKEAIEKLISDVGTDATLVAHNGLVTDFKFLHWTAFRCDIELPADWKYLDTDLLSRRLFPNIPGGYSLKNLYQYFTNRSFENGHDAANDVKSLTSLFLYLLNGRTNEELYSYMNKKQ